jgi:hypothetical protein
MVDRPAHPAVDCGVDPLVYLASRDVTEAKESSQ